MRPPNLEELGVWGSLDREALKKFAPCSPVGGPGDDDNDDDDDYDDHDYD